MKWSGAWMGFVAETKKLHAPTSFARLCASVHWTKAGDADAAFGHKGTKFGVFLLEQLVCVSCGFVPLRSFLCVLMVCLKKDVSADLAYFFQLFFIDDFYFTAVDGDELFRRKVRQGAYGVGRCHVRQVGEIFS